MYVKHKCMHYIQKQGSLGQASRKFWKFTLCKIESENIISGSTPVHGRIKEKTGVITQVITKLLPNSQIVYSTQQAVYLAHANMHIND